MTSSSLLTSRGGIPRFARLLASGKPATIVAYGTSMTMLGQYLEQRVPAVSAVSHNVGVRLVNSGLRGFTTGLAPFRLADQLLGYAPDLVFVEFAHNDVTPEAIQLIAPSLHGVIARIRSRFPDCDFVFVYLAPQGEAARGLTPAIVAYETIADYYAIASIDLATYTEQLAAAGAAWDPGQATSLTTDGPGDELISSSGRRS